jgi:hypothetical protein
MNFIIINSIKMPRANSLAIRVRRVRQAKGRDALNGRSRRLKGGHAVAFLLTRFCSSALLLIVGYKAQIELSFNWAGPIVAGSSKSRYKFSVRSSGTS